MNEPKSIPPRLRLQALLSVPDRLRTESQWDELNELEIVLALGNREATPEKSVRRNGTASAGHPKPSGGLHGKNPLKKIGKRPRKANAP
jgi:hypothetical protein